MTENFLLVSLKDEESKKLAQVISNKTSRKMLDLLAKGSATETEISEKLKLPLSTVHYNMQALVNAKLVQADEFHYSEKGKEVNHYSLANKYVIIAPKNAPGNLKERLKRILPVGLFALAGAGVLQFAGRFGGKTAEKGVLAPAAKEMDAVRAVNQAIDSSALAVEPNIALWFLFGALFALIIYVIIDFILSRK